MLVRRICRTTGIWKDWRGLNFNMLSSSEIHNVWYNFHFLSYYILHSNNINRWRLMKINCSDGIIYLVWLIDTWINFVIEKWRIDLMSSLLLLLFQDLYMSWLFCRYGSCRIDLKLLWHNSELFFLLLFNSTILIDIAVTFLF